MDKLAELGVPLRKAIAMGKIDKNYGGGKKSAPKGNSSKSSTPKLNTGKGGY